MSASLRGNNSLIANFLFWTLSFTSYNQFLHIYPHLYVQWLASPQSQIYKLNRKIEVKESLENEFLLLYAFNSILILYTKNLIKKINLFKLTN